MLAIMQVESRDLRQLQRALVGIKRAGIATQQDIAERLGIPQSTVSRAMSGKLTRHTATTRSLLNYANMLLGEAPRPDRLQRAVVDYLGAGGDSDRLADLVEAATRIFHAPSN